MADNLPAARASGPTANGAAGSHAEPAARDRVIAKRTRNTRTRSGAVLSADLIADTAMNLVSEHGAAELSVRRLGAALGCDPTAVYRYFASMDALMLAVGGPADRPGAGRLPSPARTGRRTCAPWPTAPTRPTSRIPRWRSPSRHG